MLRAVARALEIRAAQGIEGIATEAQIGRAVAAAGLGLRTDRPYVGRVRGRLYRNTIGVRRGLLEGTRRAVVAHELAHHELGHGEGFYVEGVGLAGSSPEAQAQVFAWTLLLGRPAPDLPGLTAQIHVGYAAGLPLDFLFTAASILAFRTPAVRGTPLLALA